MDSTYINRELSLLEFHKRVLAQAKDPSVPLLERLRFLCISCTNLDEFFEIRVAGLKQRMELGAPAQGPEKIPASVVFEELETRVRELVSEQYEVLNQSMFPVPGARGNFGDYGKRGIAFGLRVIVGKIVDDLFDAYRVFGGHPAIVDKPAYI